MGIDPSWQNVYRHETAFLGASGLVVRPSVNFPLCHDGRGRLAGLAQTSQHARRSLPTGFLDTSCRPSTLVGHLFRPRPSGLGDAQYSLTRRHGHMADLLFLADQSPRRLALFALPAMGDVCQHPQCLDLDSQRPHTAALRHCASIFARHFDKDIFQGRLVAKNCAQWPAILRRQQSNCFAHIAA